MRSRILGNDNDDDDERDDDNSDNTKLQTKKNGSSDHNPQNSPLPSLMANMAMTSSCLLQVRMT